MPIPPAPCSSTRFAATAASSRHCEAHETDDGVTVESEVFPVTQTPGEPGLTRPFAFTTLDHARRFADDALVAFEYLDCTVS